MFRRKNLIIISVLVLTAITFIICFSAISVKSINKIEAYSLKIVLDAGHGGIDCGVSGVNTGVAESSLNLKVVKKLQNYLIDAGFNVVLTRNNENGLYGVATSSRKKKDMLKRKEIILDANPALVVSVHMNKYSLSSRRGAQVFYKANDTLSKSLAQSIQNAFNEMEEAPRSCSPLTGDYYILNCTEIPSVIAECGFLSNPEDEALLITEKYQDKISYSIYKGIVAYLSTQTSNFMNF